MIKKNDLGISLITLVITIVVIVILVGAIVLSISNNNPIGQATEAVFKQNVKNYQEELELYKIMNLYTKEQIDINYTGKDCEYNIKIPITSIVDSDIEKFEVVMGKLVYVGEEDKENKWAEELGLIEKIIDEQYLDIQSGVLLGFKEGITQEQKTGKLIIPESVTSIAARAFENCNTISRVIMPDTIVNIGNFAFQNCYNLMSIKLSKSISKIPAGLLARCKYIRVLDIPESVIEIIGVPFSDCENLEYLNISKNISKIPFGTFFGVKSLKAITVDEANLNYFDDEGILYSMDKTNAVIPTKKSGEINIPAETKNITNLLNNTELSAINIDANNEVYASIDGIVYRKDMTGIIKYPANKTDEYYKIPDQITNMAERVFESTKYLKKVDCNNILKLEAHTFEDSNIEEVVLKEGVNDINWECFKNCKNIEKIVIPKSVKTIGENAFNGWQSEQTIYFRHTDQNDFELLNKAWNNSSAKVIWGYTGE